jgi:type II secretory pathway pseudopilin PulG
MVRIMQTLRRRLEGEGGFTIVEAMISISILAVGAFAVAQASIFGLSSTGLSRQKLSSRAAVDQQMEEARALNYDNLVLSDSSAISGSSDVNNPDYWVDQSAQTFDPDGAGPLSPEALVRVAGASPALAHYQNPLLDGATTYEVYRYVTWYDSPEDGTGASDDPDGNGDGVSDANGQDAKRVTVVVVWNDELGRGSTSLSESSLFSDGEILYKQPTSNAAPSVGCPISSVSDKTVSFTANASDSDGSIASVTWDFGDGTTGTGATVTHTYAAYQTYTVVNTVTDNAGSVASNSAAGCTVTTVSPVSGNGGPDGTIKINGDATYTNATAVTLTLTKSAGPNPSTMTFSNDNVTWLGPYGWATTYTWALSSGDGTKTVYMRLYDSSGKYGAIASDTIILDTVAPATPTGFAKSSTTVGVVNTTITFTWNPVGATDLGGYRVYRRLITSTGSYSLVCDTSSTTCTDTHKKTDTYEYYIVAYDLATNVSAGSTPHLTG